MCSADIYRKFKHLYLQMFTTVQTSQTKTQPKIKTKINSKQNIAKKRTTILLVEDNVDLQDALKIMLQDFPYKIAIASNGKEGLEYLRKHKSKTAFILLDIAMPIMGGLEFLSIVKKDSALKQIPIIIQSASCDEIIQECMAKGADDYVQKPYTKEVLYASIKKLNKKREGKYGKRIMQRGFRGF